MSNWPVIKLRELLTESKVESSTPDSGRRIRVKLNVGGVEQRPETNDKEGATKYYIRRAGQFIYGKQNLHKGAFGIVPNELDGFESSSDIPAFDVNEACYPEWIFYFFKQGNFYLRLESIAKGIGSKRIQPKQLFDLNIFLPPKEEQRKILDSVRSFEESLFQLDTVINKQLVLVRDFRKSVLRDAISGELTKTWRLSDKQRETGLDLLNKITATKQKLINDNKIRIEKNFPAVSANEKRFKLPGNWAWTRLNEIKDFGTTISYGVLIPEGHSLDGVPLIRVGDLEGYREGSMPSKYIKKEIADKYKKTELYGGEILITVVGSTIGKSALAHNNWKGANIARAIARISVNEFVDNKFLHIVIQSPYMQGYFMERIKSVGQPTLNINVLEKAPIPLPPLSEQKIISQKVESLITSSEQVKEHAEGCKLKSQELEATFLKELFGEPNPSISSESPIMTYDADEIFKGVYNSVYTSIKISAMIELELVELLKTHGQMPAVKLWKMSRYENDIDAFYEELKKQVEEEKTIKESSQKGYLELAQ